MIHTRHSLSYLWDIIILGSSFKECDSVAKFMSVLLCLLLPSNQPLIIASYGMPGCE